MSDEGVPTVTCPQCGSLVEVGKRRCANCGARQKDFAPAPVQYTTNTTVTPVATPLEGAHDRRDATEFPPPPPPYGSATAAVPATAVPAAAVPAAAVPAAAVPASGQGPSPAQPRLAARLTGRVRGASLGGRALLFSLAPLLVLVVEVVLFLVIVAIGVAVDDGGATVVLVVFGLLLPAIGGLAGIAFTVLAYVYAVRALRESRTGDLSGRGIAIAAIVIASVQVLITLTILGAFINAVASASTSA